MTEEQKSLGQVAYKARWAGRVVESGWETADQCEWERAAQAVVDAYVAREKSERKGKRLAALEARIEQVAQSHPWGANDVTARLAELSEKVNVDGRNIDWIEGRLYDLERKVRELEAK